MDSNRLIGKQGGLPWHIPGELAYFKRTTMGKPVIMGRKTYESIGRPLPGRTNIVITGNEQWQAPGVVVCGNLPSALAHGQSVAREPETATDEVMVIGGAQICRAAMPLVQRLYLTVVNQAYEGDTWLDAFDWDNWRTVSENKQDPADTGGLPVTYWVLEKA
ncbi:MAG: dihydrofolate reductase [Granulosicoccus sp.]